MSKQSKTAKCPFHHTAPQMTAQTPSNRSWWPENLDLSLLSQQPAQADPMGAEFDYAAEFMSLNLAELKSDLAALMTDSQEWWPADYGHYGPFFVRMAWHSAGTYRTFDGRGGAGAGTLRFAPLNSWPDNGNLDKARRLLWPIKQKYGRKISWADLMVLTGNVALESMGFETLGFAGGRVDRWVPEADINWGTERGWLDGQRRDEQGELHTPFGAVQMGLIYVNPEGPDGVPDPLASARDIRETFARMAMDDEETVALIAGGHTFGKAHGAASPQAHVGREPEGAAIEAQGLGWENSLGTGHGEHTITSGLEGAWTTAPATWDHNFFENLFGYEWELSKSPAGAHQWLPSGGAGARIVPDAHDSTKRHAPMMATTDLALRFDPIYAPIAKHFHDNPQAFADAFARAWFKLTHRDMGPRSRYLGAEVPTEPALWQDPLPACEHALPSSEQLAQLKAKILSSGLGVSQLVSCAWASASTYRSSDMRGGANGGRVRLAPQATWAVNEPEQLAKVVATLESLAGAFNEAQAGAARISVADMIVLGGHAAIERAASLAGVDLILDLQPGRVDATQESTDVDSFAVLEPQADAFRNFVRHPSAAAHAERHLLDKSQLLGLSAPQMTVLVGGMRALGANHSSAGDAGVLTDRPGVLSTDFFVNLLDMSTQWVAVEAQEGSQVYEGRDRATGSLRWTATRADLIFGSHSQLRALAEVYASEDGHEKFVHDFAAAWATVMRLDRFDVKRRA